MKSCILIIALFFLSSTAFAYQVHIKVEAFEDKETAYPVLNALVKSGPYEQMTDFNGEVSYYHISSDILEGKVTILHPEYSFPEYQLKEYPYIIEGDRMVFTISGMKIPSAQKQTLNVAAATSKKAANTLVKLRCRAFNQQDSLLLLDVNNKYIASFQNGGSSQNHVLYDVPLHVLKAGGKIFNVHTEEHTSFGPNDWTHILSFQDFSPIQRADSEFKSITFLLDQIQAVHREHNFEIFDLKSEIEHLEDSISQILNPVETTIFPEEIPEPPVAVEIVDFPTEPAQPSIQEDVLREELAAIIKNARPKKTGKIVIELTIEKNGTLSIQTTAHSKEHADIEHALRNYLTTQQWTPNKTAGKVHKSTQIFEFNILQE